MRYIPELLAPAGNRRQLTAAVENGADAVYMGGTAFNARMGAENFDTGTMKEAILYAHRRDVRVYVTMNTLINDRELPEAVAHAAAAYEAGADGIIIQDLGFADLLKTYFPQIPLHLSTQGTIFNQEGVNAAESLGFSRVVLARELSLAEIREITESCNAEIEVFVHGALCFCYSGQCQMSRHIGGRSGNRGACAQPCRLPYSLETDPAYENEGSSIAGNGYLLSPKDICTIDYLKELSLAGIASIKIEGRLKSPEYVAAVVSIYRKYLDCYRDTGEYQVSNEDRQMLLQIFNRGGFTDGYLAGNPGVSLMSAKVPKHLGIPAGKVTGFERNRRLVHIKLSENLSLGDGIEIHSGEKRTGNVVTYLRKREDRQSGQNWSKGRVKKQDFTEKKNIDGMKGDHVTVGYLDGAVAEGDTVYKITDKKMMERLRSSFEGMSGSQEKAAKKAEIDFCFEAFLDKPAKLSAKYQGEEITCLSESNCQEAIKKPLDEEQVRKQLSKTGGTDFRINSCKIVLGEKVSLPVSALNKMRRQVLDQIARKVESKDSESRQLTCEQKAHADAELKKRSSISAAGNAHKRNCEPQKTSLAGSPDSPVNLGIYLFRPDPEELLKQCDLQIRLGSRPVPVSRFYLPYTWFIQSGTEYGNVDAELATVRKRTIDRLRESGLETLPYLPLITKGLHDIKIRENLRTIREAADPWGISVGNLGWAAAFQKSGAKVIGDYGLNLYNSADFQAAGKLGLARGVLSHELSDDPDYESLLEGLDFCGLEAEAAVGGTLPVMHTAHCVLGDLRENSRNAEEKCSICQTGRFFLRDRKGEKYRVISDKLDCSSIVFGHKTEIDWEKGEKFIRHGVNNLRIYGIDKSLIIDTCEP